MDGLFHGKPLLKWYDLGGHFPLFLVQHPNVPYRDFEMATSKQAVLDVSRVMRVTQDEEKISEKWGLTKI